MSRERYPEDDLRDALLREYGPRAAGPAMTTPARDLHAELAQAHEDALVAFTKAEWELSNFPGLWNEELLARARRKLEKIATRIRISEGRG